MGFNSDLLRFDINGFSVLMVINRALMGFNVVIHRILTGFHGDLYDT